ncbi:MAG: BNR/Asp-box repeat protein [Ignavibacteria bacterium]|nr:BNR/Asp-box repeat protein [Ignavibacteria bacterium]
MAKTGLSILVFCLFITYSYSQDLSFTHIGPATPSIDLISSTGNFVIAGGLGGAYISTNNGETWLKTLNLNKNIMGFAFDGKKVLAATNDFDGLFISSDSGKIWLQLGLANNVCKVTSFAQIDSFAFLSCNSSKTISRRNIRSSLNWEQIPYVTSPILALASMNKILYAGTTFNGILSSSDLGQSWENTKITNRKITKIITYDSTAIFAFSDTTGVFRSSDGGSTWEHLPCNNTSVNNISKSDGIIYSAFDSSGVFKSAGNGASWTQTNLNNRKITSLHASGNTIFAGSESSGIFKSTDGGTSWIEKPLYLGISALENSGDLIISGSKNYGMYKSTDFGKTWVTPSIPKIDLLSIKSYETNLFCIGYNPADYSLSGLYRSADSGSSWKNIYKIDGVRDLIIHKNSVFFMYADDNAPDLSGLFRSTDNGATWASKFKFSSDCLLAQNKNEIFAFTYDWANPNYPSKLKHSLDNGESWTDADLKKKYLDYLACNYDYVFAISSDTLIRSTDKGNTWQVTSFTGKKASSITVIGNNIYIGTTFNGIFRSTDNGAKWRNLGLFNAYITTINLAEGKIIAGTANDGIYYASDPTISEVKPEWHQYPVPESNFKIELLPNPVVDNLTIRYFAENETPVSITITDMLGSQIFAKSDIYSHAGFNDFNIKLNGINFPSGIYFCILRLNGSAAYNKFILTN